MPTKQYLLLHILGNLVSRYSYIIFYACVEIYHTHYYYVLSMYYDDRDTEATACQGLIIHMSDVNSS